MMKLDKSAAGTTSRMKREDSYGNPSDLHKSAW